MGGKRAYARQVLEIIGDWPRDVVMVDTCPAVMSFWRFAFAGRLPEVAEAIRGYELDGEELWRAITTSPVPADEVERLAAWIIVQKGNFSGKPTSWAGGEWGNRGGYNPPTDLGDWRSDGYGTVSEAAIAKGFTERVVRDCVADKLAEWSGVAGFSESIDGFPSVRGIALSLDLVASSPAFEPGDLVAIDPPYKGTEGYGKAKLHRERVVELALEAHGAGCRVLVHEAESVLMGGPWRAVELHRKNQQDTWRARGKNGRREFVSINFEPRGQRSLF
jgi:hypothetical protein